MNELYTQGMRSVHLIHAIARITMMQILNSGPGDRAKDCLAIRTIAE